MKTSQTAERNKNNLMLSSAVENTNKAGKKAKKKCNNRENVPTPAANLFLQRFIHFSLLASSFQSSNSLFALGDVLSTIVVWEGKWQISCHLSPELRLCLFQNPWQTEKKSSAKLSLNILFFIHPPLCFDCIISKRILNFCCHNTLLRWRVVTLPVTASNEMKWDSKFFNKKWMTASRSISPHFALVRTLFSEETWTNRQEFHVVGAQHHWQWGLGRSSLAGTCVDVQTFNSRCGTI